MSRCKARTNSGSRCKNTAVEGSDYCYLHEENNSKLSKKRERFCQLYVSKEFFGNGTQSYIEAYGLDAKKDYESARRMASSLLTKVDICNRINQMLDEAGLNDNFVDKQLLMMLTQNADFSNKMAAIREYNKLKARIVDKVEDVTKHPRPLVIMKQEADG